jgi:hypothetical protein
MAFVPDEAIVDACDLSPGAWRLYGYYCMKRNKETRGWNCPKAAVLKEMPKMTKETYFRSKRELLDEGWIVADKDFITPIKGFRSVKNDTIREDDLPPNPDSVDVDSGQNPAENTGEIGVKNDPKLDENGVKNDTDLEVNSVKNDTAGSVKNDNGSVKNDTDSVKNDTAPLKEFLPAHNTSPLDQEEKNKQKVSSEADGLSREEKLELEMNLVFTHWQRVLEHPRADLDDKRKAILRARFRAGYSAMDLMAVIDGVKRSPWHMGKNPERRQFHKFETIFRDADQIETFTELAKGKSPPADDASEDHQVPARMSFEELVFVAYEVNESEPTMENYEATKASYLGETPAPELIAEVENYERGNEYRQRFCKTGQGASC